jgi:hypothetical protein
MDPMLGGVIAQLQEHIVGVSAIADDLTQQRPTRRIRWLIPCRELPAPSPANYRRSSTQISSIAQFGGEVADS